MNSKPDPSTVYSREQKNIILDPIKQWTGTSPQTPILVFFPFLRKSHEPTKSNRSFAFGIHRTFDLLIFFFFFFRSNLPWDFRLWNWSLDESCGLYSRPLLSVFSKLGSHCQCWGVEIHNSLHENSVISCQWLLFSWAAWYLIHS